ncbi:MAG: asparaginase domain-containing protein [Clostridiales bacterium]|nr:asparaginase domain-containing protein [Clostridiales bacterium]
MTDKILLIGTGGTIACREDKSIHFDKPFKILDYAKSEILNSDFDYEFECASPFAILSENMDFPCWKKLIDFISAADFEKYKGVIILHGSDTLSFTASLIGNMFFDKPIVLIASDKPLEDKTANGIKNFKTALENISKGKNGVYVSYDGFYKAADKNIENPHFKPKNILVIKPYVGIDYDNYNLENTDAVLHTMYHSATAPKNVSAFCKKCKDRGIPFYFVTENKSAEYESAEDFENIIFSSLA